MPAQRELQQALQPESMQELVLLHHLLVNAPLLLPQAPLPPPTPPSPDLFAAAAAAAPEDDGDDDVNTSADIAAADASDAAFAAVVLEFVFEVCRFAIVFPKEICDMFVITRSWCVDAIAVPPQLLLEFQQTSHLQPR